MLRLYPTPPLIVLAVCGVAIAYASQQPASYDPAWFAVCTVLFVAGCFLAFNIMKSMPVPRMRISVSRVTWHRAKFGLAIGIVALAASLGWLLWGKSALPGGNWMSITFVMLPTLGLGGIGLALIYYWLGLWAFGEMQKDEPPPADEPRE
jgi:hypothetical protein